MIIPHAAVCAFALHSPPSPRKYPQVYICTSLNVFFRISTTSKLFSIADETQTNAYHTVFTFAYETVMIFGEMCCHLTRMFTRYLHDKRNVHDERFVFT